MSNFVLIKPLLYSLQHL